MLIFFPFQTRCPRLSCHRPPPSPEVTCIWRSAAGSSSCLPRKLSCRRGCNPDASHAALTWQAYRAPLAPSGTAGTVTAVSLVLRGVTPGTTQHNTAQHRTAAKATEGSLCDAIKPSRLLPLNRTDRRNASWQTTSGGVMWNSPDKRSFFWSFIFYFFPLSGTVIVSATLSTSLALSPLSLPLSLSLTLP